MKVLKNRGRIIEHYHAKILAKFHEWRKGITSDDFIEIDGKMLNDILANAKLETISEFTPEYFSVSDAAPDVLEALEWLLDRMKKEDIQISMFGMGKCMTAINKAKGLQP